MYPHRIRLRGPWVCQPLPHAPGGPAPPPFRVTMPCRWADAGQADVAGRVRCRRRFGYPGRLKAHERVWLTFAGVADRACVTLNDTPLGQVEGDTPAEFEVTALLGPRNELVVDVEGPGGQGGLWGEVALEVRCTAFLRGVRAEAVGDGGVFALHVAGEVVGVADGPLDLYVILGRSPLSEARVTARAEGTPFHLAVGGLDRQRLAGETAVQVDLVNGATVWYTARQGLTFGGA
jgi:hypothetical protein